MSRRPPRAPLADASQPPFPPFPTQNERAATPSETPTSPFARSHTTGALSTPSFLTRGRSGTVRDPKDEAAQIKEWEAERQLHPPRIVARQATLPRDYPPPQSTPSEPSDGTSEPTHPSSPAQSREDGTVHRVVSRDGISRRFEDFALLYDGTGSRRDPLTILHFNDVYNIEPGSSGVGGVSRFIAALQAQHRPGRPPPLVFFSGDAFNPSMLSTHTRGKHMVPFLSMMHIHTACYGNHDFDFGLDSLEYLAGSCNFPWVVSNAWDPLARQPLGNGSKYRLFEWQRWKVGVMGLIEREWLDTLATINPDDVTYTHFVDEADRLSAMFRAKGVDLIIALTHMRSRNDMILAREARDIDLILGGHDHGYYGARMVVKGGKKRTVVVKSGTDFREFSKLTFHPKALNTRSGEQSVKNDGASANERKVLNVPSHHHRQQPQHHSPKHERDQCLPRKAKEENLAGCDDTSSPSWDIVGPCPSTPVSIAEAEGRDDEVVRSQTDQPDATTSPPLKTQRPGASKEERPCPPDTSGEASESETSLYDSPRKNLAESESESSSAGGKGLGSDADDSCFCIDPNEREKLRCSIIPGEITDSPTVSPAQSSGPSPASEQRSIASPASPSGAPRQPTQSPPSNKETSRRGGAGVGVKPEADGGGGGEDDEWLPGNRSGGTFELPAMLEGSILDWECIEVLPELFPTIRAIDQMVAQHHKHLEASMRRVIGETAVPLETRFSVIRTEETNAGDWLADLMRSHTKSDIAIVNAGTVRSDCVFPPGFLRMRDVVAMLPMVDPLCVISVTGAHLLSALENGVSQWPKHEGRFPQVGGVRFEFYTEAPPGRRIDPSTVKVERWAPLGLQQGQASEGGKSEREWQPLQLSERYSLCTKSYIREGKDGFNCLAYCPVIRDEEVAGNLPTIIRNAFQMVAFANGFKRPMNLLTKKHLENTINSPAILHRDFGMERVNSSIRGSVAQKPSISDGKGQQRGGNISRQSFGTVRLPSEIMGQQHNSSPSSSNASSRKIATSSLPTPAGINSFLRSKTIGALPASFAPPLYRVCPIVDGRISIRKDLRTSPEYQSFAVKREAVQSDVSRILQEEQDSCGNAPRPAHSH